MNRKRNAGLALCALAVLGLLVACTTFESNTGKVIGVSTTTVSKARQAWVAYVTEQRVLQPDVAKRQDLEVKVAKVGVAYARYQDAMEAANKALTAYHLAPVDQSPVTTAIQALSAASGDLVGLIKSLLPTAIAATIK